MELESRKDGIGGGEEEEEEGRGFNENGKVLFTDFLTSSYMSKTVLVGYALVSYEQAQNSMDLLYLINS